MAPSSPRSPTAPLSPSAQVVRQLFYDTSAPLIPKLNNSTVVALAQAPFQTSHACDLFYLACADEFFEDNPLIAATLQPRTQQVYAVALENFRSSPFAKLPNALPLVHRLCLYIQDGYMQNPNPGHRQEMANLLSIILLMIPSLRGNYLGLSRRCLSGWRALHPAKSFAPFTKGIALALSWHLVTSGNPEAACVLLVSFCGCLRLSEVLSLQIQDIALPGDARLAHYGPDIAGLNIREAKTARYTGSLQFVKIEDIDAIKFLQAWVTSTTHTTGPFVRLRYQTYAAVLKGALAAFGLHKSSFTSHSARIGKATQDYVAGVPVQQIAVNGGWKSLNSLRYYVTNGRAWLLDSKIPPPSNGVYLTPLTACSTSFIKPPSPRSH